MPLALRYFGGAGLAHMQQYGTQLDDLREDPRQGEPPRGATTRSRCSARCVTEDEVLAVAGDVARRDDAPDGLPADLRRGRGGRLLGRRSRASHGLRRRRAHPRAGDDDRHARRRSRRATCARWSASAWRAPRRAQVYEAAGIGPEDVDVVELHDCFAQNELISYEALGLCPARRRRAVRRRRRQHLRRQGRHQSVGRPAVQGPPARRDRPGAVHRARAAAARHAGARQVDGARLALQHNLGLGGACVVTLYERKASG